MHNTCRETYADTCRTRTHECRIMQNEAYRNRRRHTETYKHMQKTTHAEEFINMQNIQRNAQTQ